MSGGGGFKGQGKRTNGKEETMRLNNLGGIKSGGGSLSTFVVFREDAIYKGKNCCFPPRCVIYCDNRIYTHFIIESRK